jgi:hypothetical protein
MRKIYSIAIALITMTTASYGQAVRDRNVIPLAVNLNQVLRMSITDGGNIEFTFNSIEDYRFGLSGDAGTSGSSNPATSDPMYVSNFIIASSTRWELSYGSEQPDFIGTDNPGNTLTLDNVGFTLLSNGIHTFGTELTSAPTVDGSEVSALEQFPVVLITDNGDLLSSAGDVLDNDFTIIWRAGTAEVGAAPATMNPIVLLEQNPSPNPDRYVTSVLFELAAL